MEHVLVLKITSFTQIFTAVSFYKSNQETNYSKHCTSDEDTITPLCTASTTKF